LPHTGYCQILDHQVRIRRQIDTSLQRLGLERGVVVEFADVEPPVRAKLAWISPKRTVYLFTARGAKARHISPSELAGALREGRARRLADSGTVIDRALAAAVGEEE
jgi:hypothetical protein